MKFFASFKDKRFRYGTLSTVMILFSIAIFVFVNLVADQLNITKDLTGDEMYTLSEYSIEYLQEDLTADVNIYALMATGQENLMLSQLLEEYAASSSHVNVEYRDPNLYPTFVEQFAEPDQPIEAGSIIVQSGGRHKVIAPDEMYTTEFDPNTWQEYVTAINYEPQISKAIHNVIQGDSPVIYHVNGNGEAPLSEALMSHLSTENFTVKTVDLVLNDVPEDCDTLLITTPQRDWSTDEKDKVEEYLQYNGNAMFILDYAQTRFANLDELLASYGIRIGDYIVVEGDAAHTYGGVPFQLVPDFGVNDITQPLIDMNYKSIMLGAPGIDQLEMKRASTKYDVLLSTSGSAYGKQNTQSESLNKEPGDLDGPFNLGLAISDSIYADTTYNTKMVVFGGSSILDEVINLNHSGGSNWALLTSGFNWMAGVPESIYVPAKSPSQVAPLMITQLDANVLMFVAVILLPLIFVVAGTVVWFRRRHN